MNKKKGTRNMADFPRAMNYGTQINNLKKKLKSEHETNIAPM